MSDVPSFFAELLSCEGEAAKSPCASTARGVHFARSTTAFVIGINSTPAFPMGPRERRERERVLGLSSTFIFPVNSVARKEREKKM